ncbi:hypothetical protein [Erythrobacter sp. F6033]|uniref:DUF4870 family protein n=1 Tax=Erythrobacter sp. F6033 TaxID=2926401 RepID=UPI001FF49B95|nr:hypothetical protein [Erythrobacter sp. F6033]MCK0129489.1 hypothetical protein [Erythrobacter sp. F6033]
MDEKAHDKQTGKPQTGLNLSRPIIVGILFLGSILVPFSGMIGVVLAHIWRGDSDTQEWERSHFTYLIRTFWVSFVLFIAAFVVWFGSFFAMIPHNAGSGGEPSFAFFAIFFGMFLVFLALMAWGCVRTILSIVRAGKSEPMPNPQSWLF